MDDEHRAGWHLELPPGARFVWPALPHNPYRKDGAATVDEALRVAVLPLAPDATGRQVRLRIEG